MHINDHAYSPIIHSQTNTITHKHTRWCVRFHVFYSQWCQRGIPYGLLRRIKIGNMKHDQKAGQPVLLRWKNCWPPTTANRMPNPAKKNMRLRVISLPLFRSYPRKKFKDQAGLVLLSPGMRKCHKIPLKNGTDIFIASHFKWHRSVCEPPHWFFSSNKTDSNAFYGNNFSWNTHAHIFIRFDRRHFHGSRINQRQKQSQ